MGITISQKALNLLSITSNIIRFFNDPERARRSEDPEVCDFTYGNPQEMPLAEFSEALIRWSVPQNKDWFAYKTSEPAACQVVADSLRALHHMPFDPQDIFMTNGAFAAIAVAIGTITDPGDEIIFISPPWFF